jgi:hypothetical protein
VRVVVEGRKVAGTQDLFKHLVGRNTQFILEVRDEVDACLNFDRAVVDFDGDEMGCGVLMMAVRVVVPVVAMLRVMTVLLVVAVLLVMRMLVVVALRLIVAMRVGVAVLLDQLVMFAEGLMSPFACRLFRGLHIILLRLHK